MKFEHGDRKLFGTYLSSHGPIRISLDDYIWDDTIKNWVIDRSIRGIEIVKETVNQK